MGAEVMKAILETERLVLREMTEADANARKHNDDARQCRFALLRLRAIVSPMAAKRACCIFKVVLWSTTASLGCSRAPRSSDHGERADRSGAALSQQGPDGGATRAAELGSLFTPMAEIEVGQGSRNQASTRVFADNCPRLAGAEGAAEVRKFSAWGKDAIRKQRQLATLGFGVLHRPMPEPEVRLLCAFGTQTYALVFLNDSGGLGTYHREGLVLARTSRDGHSVVEVLEATPPNTGVMPAKDGPSYERVGTEEIPTIVFASTPRVMRESAKRTQRCDDGFLTTPTLLLRRVRFPVR